MRVALVFILWAINRIRYESYGCDPNSFLIPLLREEGKNLIGEGEVYLALPSLANYYHYQEQGVQQLILNKPVNKPISFRWLMG